MPLTGAIPQNQLNALPLQTATQAVAPDVVSIQGQKLTKYWGPAAAGVSGINFTADPDLAASSAIFSSYLDFTGMNEFTALLVATIPGAGAVSNVNCNLRIQYRTPGGGVQPRSGSVGALLWTSVANRTPNYGILGTPNTYVVAYSWTNPQGGVTVGPDARLWFGLVVVPTAGQLYDLHVWACQS